MWTCAKKKERLLYFGQYVHCSNEVKKLGDISRRSIVRRQTDHNRYRQNKHIQNKQQSLKSM